MTLRVRPSNVRIIRVLTRELKCRPRVSLVLLIAILIVTALVLPGSPVSSAGGNTLAETVNRSSVNPDAASEIQEHSGQQLAGTVFGPDGSPVEGATVWAVSFELLRGLPPKNSQYGGVHVMS